MAAPGGTPIVYPRENDGPRILGVTLAITITALLTMLARLFVRIRMIRNVGWDDYIMCSAMVLCIAGQCIIIPQVHYGAGKHIDQVPNLAEAFKLNFVTQPLYLFAICLVKESIGFFLLRIAIVPFYRKTIISIMVFMAIYTVACFFTVVFQCTNLAVLWDKNASGTCWGPTTLKALSYTNVSLNILTDLLFSIIIPIPMLWTVQMNRRQKISVIAILALGIFATTACLVKISFLTNYGKFGDYLWDSRDITIWTVLESNVGIIAGNLPCLKPLFRTVLGSTYGRGSRGRSGQPKYFSRPYGAGTGHGTGKNDNYNSLGSSKTREPGFSPYGGYESHMMTTIGVDKERSSSPSSTRDEAHNDKASADSVVLLDDQARPAGKHGGILKTTEVSTHINFADSRRDLEDGLRPERKEAHMV